MSRYLFVGCVIAIFLPCSMATGSDDQNITECPKDWLPWKDHCYYFSNTSRSYWELAYSACIQLGFPYGGWLVSIHSDEENEFVFSLGKETHDPIHIGLFNSTLTHEDTWADQTNVTYTNYGPFQNMSNTFYHCMMHPDHGQWYKYTIDMSMPYYCKCPRQVVSTPIPTTDLLMTETVADRTTELAWENTTEPTTDLGDVKTTEPSD